MDKDGKFWRRALNIRRQALAESETSSETEKDTNNLAKKCSNRCSCKFCPNCSPCRSELEEPEHHVSLLRSKSSLLSTHSGSKASNRNSTYKSKLETKIINDEMTEQLCYDKHNSSKKQIQDFSTLLRSFFSYCHSLDFRYHAAARVQQVLFEISEKDTTVKCKERISMGISRKIKDIMALCHKNIDIPHYYYESCNEYSDKYKDHAEAAFNFYYFLQSGDLSHSQMRDCEMEYDRVRERFNESKTSVSSLLSSIINQRYDVIQACVEKVLPLLTEMMEQDKEIYNMLKGLSSSSNLRAVPKGAPSSKSIVNESSKSPRMKPSDGSGCKNPRNRCCSEENVVDEF